MFRFFVNPGGMTMLDLSELHPSLLEALLERSWNFQLNTPALPLGHPDHRSDVSGRPNVLLNPTLAFQVPRIPPRAGNINVPALDAAIQAVAPPPGIRSHHAIYAYMIQNTRVLEVMRRVVDGFLHGERMSTLSAASQRWLWTTEELFFRDPPPFSVGTQTS